MIKSTLYSLKLGRGSTQFIKWMLAAAFLFISLMPADALNKAGIAGNTEQIIIKGKVVDNVTKEALPGVNVVIIDYKIGTSTNSEGEFEISIPVENVTLSFSFIGYITKEMVARSGYMEVFLEPETTLIDDVVVVGFGAVKKENLTGAISNIKNEDILKTTHTSLAQNLQGKIAGLQIRQNSGQPGDFDETINIRGFGSPLYVIDGIPRGGSVEFQKLNPEDIESISVLKDASAAIFGINAANGVIIITTKRGRSGNAKFHLNNVVGIMVPTDVVEMCNASQYMDIRNDAGVNAGGTPFISQEELEKYHNGEPGYIGTDWYDVTFKPFALMDQHTISTEGGNDFATYFVSMGYQNEGSILRSNDMYYKKYTYKSSITANLTKNLVASVILSGRFDNKFQPGGSYFNIFKGTRVSLPTDEVYANDNPDYLSNVYGNLHPLALSDADISGYTSTKGKLFNSIASLTYNAPFLKGLQVKGIFSYTTNDSFIKDLEKSYKVYTYDSETESYIPNVLQSPSTISNAITDVNNTVFQAHLIYNKTVAAKHNIGATLAYEQRQSFSRYSYLSRDYDFFTNDQINQGSTNNQQTDGTEVETANLSYIGRFTYDFNKKYLLEFAFRYDGSYRYHPDRRWGFFPVISGGWKISEESFIKDQIPSISNLKLRGSYGLVGEDSGVPFQYLSGFSTTGGGGYEFSNGVYTNGVASPSLTNEYLTWSTSAIADIGLEFGIFHGALFGELDIYQRDREGLLATRLVSLPNTFGATLPQENINSDRVQGIDFSLNFRDKIHDFSYTISANFNYSRTKYLYIESAPYTSSYSRWKYGATDRWSDIVWAYTYAGQFTSEDDVSSSPGQNGTLGNLNELPGDFKYADINGDGIINQNDMLPIFTNGTPKIHYGLNINARYKGFDLNILLQGSAMYTLMFNEVYATVMCFNGNTPAYFWDRWHLEDPYDPTSEWVAGKYPPSRTWDVSGYSMYNESNRWRYDASYVRLKSLELGYSIPASLKWLSLSDIRVYFNAHNLFTICNKFVRPFDPEKIEGSYSAGFTYPLTKSYNFGVNITF